MKLRIATRAACAVLLTWLVVAPYPPAFAAAAQARHHYEITGGLMPSTDTTAGSASTHFSANEPYVLQVANGFELSARLVAAPNACSADTIFVDGFDP
ncbi:MAG TPA: hypothetical protein VGO25_11100 [Rhodanobacteraceae bacterium]|jgi:hypothetical protein|nr:hypothetical protein [Rhodanobacteraceae bacterium]